MPDPKPSSPAPAWFSNLPIDGAALDFIKICAAILMVIDHIDHVFWNYENFEMYLLGRGTFPLFCFAAAAALLRATPEKARDQCLKLLCLAILCEPVSILVRAPLVSDMPANVIFTLAAGSAMALTFSAWNIWIRHIIFAGAVASVWIGETVEFGLMGIMLVPAIFQVLRGDKSALPWMALLLMTINTGGLGKIMINPQPPLHPGWWLIPLLSGMAAIALPALIINFARVIKGKTRLLPRFALHIFYPAHLALLGLLKLLIR